MLHMRGKWVRTRIVTLPFSSQNGPMSSLFQKAENGPEYGKENDQKKYSQKLLQNIISETGTDGG